MSCIHKAQGATADRVFVLADDTMAREHLYTAMSRGVTRNDLYLVVDDQRADIRHAPEVVNEPDEAVRSAVRRSAAKSMAVDVGAADDPFLTPKERVEALRYDLALAREGLAELENAYAGSLARRDQAWEDLERLPIALPAIRRRLKTEAQERLAIEEKDIAVIEPFVLNARRRCQTLEQEIRGQSAVAERGPIHNELPSALDAVSAEGATVQPPDLGAGRLLE